MPGQTRNRLVTTTSLLVKGVPISLLRSIRWLVVLAVVLGSPPSAVAHLDGPHDNMKFEIRFTCEGFGAAIPVDAETARQEGEVPAQFRFVREQDTGVTDASVGAFYCKEFTVDEAATAPLNYSLVSIALDAPHSGESYDIWQFMDLKEWHHRIEAFGGWTRLRNDISVDVSRVGGADGAPVSGHADVPWPQSPYTIDAVMPGTVPVPQIPFPSDHWFYGPHGSVHAQHENLGLSVVEALISVDTTPGTPLARVLGGDVTSFPGLYLQFSGCAVYRAEQFSGAQNPAEPCEPSRT